MIELKWPYKSIFQDDNEAYSEVNKEKDYLQKFVNSELGRLIVERNQISSDLRRKFEEFKSTVLWKHKLETQKISLGDNDELNVLYVTATPSSTLDGYFKTMYSQGFLVSEDRMLIPLNHSDPGFKCPDDPNNYINSNNGIKLRRLSENEFNLIMIDFLVPSSLMFSI